MRKKEGHKERDIIKAAIKVFAKNGFHNAKVAEIAEVAKVGTGSIYLYFDNKVDILDKIFEKLWIKLTEETQKIMETEIEPEVQIEKYVDLLLNELISNHNLAAVYINEQDFFVNKKGVKFKKHYLEFYDLIEQIFSEGIKNKVFTSEIELNTLKFFFIGGIKALIHQHISSPNKLDIADIKKEIMHIIVKGIKKAAIYKLSIFSFQK